MADIDVVMSPTMESTNIIPIWCEDIYYKIALCIETPRDLLTFAATCRGLRACAQLLFSRSSMEVCVSLKSTDVTSYAAAINPHATINEVCSAGNNDEYILFSDWCQLLLQSTNNKHGLQKVQYYKNIRSMLFVNAYLTPAGRKLVFMRCKCGALSRNRIMFEVAKLETVRFQEAPVGGLSRLYRALWPPQQSTSRRLTIDCHHMCVKCMYNVSFDQTTPIALNNYAKATLSTTLHLNDSKIMIRNAGWLTLIK